jgi:hypothetical protein
MRMGRAGLPVAHRRRVASGLVTMLLILLPALLLEGCAHPRSLPTSVVPPAAPASIPTPIVTAESMQSTPTSTPAPTSAPAPTTPSPAPGQPYIRSKIEIVWPHNNVPVREATRANVTAYLIAGQGNEPPPCDWDPVVHLWAAQSGSAARVVATGQKRMLSQGGSTFPAWDFNDVDVSAAQDPTGKLAFFATVEGVPTYPNIWVYAGDPRTIFPQADMPQGVTDRRPAAVDARIEIVWPHDGAPVDQADRANITVYLFDAGSKTALSPSISWLPVVRLHHSLNVDPEQPETAVAGQPRTITVNGITFEAWDFNDVDVSAARDPLNRLYFWASVDDVPAYSNIWAHGADARTFFPEPETLSSCR